MGCGSPLLLAMLLPSVRARRRWGGSWVRWEADMRPRLTGRGSSALVGWGALRRRAPRAPSGHPQGTQGTQGTLRAPSGHPQGTLRAPSGHPGHPQGTLRACSPTRVEASGAPAWAWAKAECSTGGAQDRYTPALPYPAPGCPACPALPGPTLPSPTLPCPQAALPALPYPALPPGCLRRGDPSGAGGPGHGAPGSASSLLPPVSPAPGARACHQAPCDCWLTDYPVPGAQAYAGPLWSPPPPATPPPPAAVGAGWQGLRGPQGRLPH